MVVTLLLLLRSETMTRAPPTSWAQKKQEQVQCTRHHEERGSGIAPANETRPNGAHAPSVWAEIPPAGEKKGLWPVVIQPLTGRDKVVVPIIIVVVALLWQKCLSVTYVKANEVLN